MLLKYIISHTKTIIMLLVFCAIFAGVLALFALPVLPCLYAALICFVVGIPVAAYDFYRYAQRHKALVQVAKSATTEDVVLPEAHGAVEADYAALVCRLCREKAALRSDYDRHLTELDDYYTLWVHQIKTPIAAMSVLLQSGDGGEIPLSALKGELFKIERYVELVLQFLRLDSISQDLRLVPVNLEGAVRQSVKKYATLFIASHLSLKTESLDTSVVSDEKWLCFMLEQIISNAIKYTHEGGEISLYCVRRSLFVEDTGIGISAEDLPRIFERGFTGLNGRRDKKSTGLGLYLCSRVAKKLSVKLDAESEPGHGTRIILTFPEEIVPE